MTNIELVYTLAVDIGVSTITSMSLAKEKLKRWYESLGFKVRKAIPHSHGELKTYLMVKHL